MMVVQMHPGGPVGHRCICGDMGEMAFGLLLFKGRQEFIFERRNSAQAPDSKQKVKMTPVIAASQGNRENKFFRPRGRATPAASP